MDTDYRKCCTDFDLTLTVLATVISKTEDQRIVVDAGLKAVSCERGLPMLKSHPGLTIRKLTAEHGIIDLQDGATAVQVGDKIQMWVHYADATVNLHRRMYGIRGGRVAEIFQVDCSRW
jgi:D-serine deaminase-like pyridoxal phosphate-dependent protein